MTDALLEQAAFFELSYMKNAMAATTELPQLDPNDMGLHPFDEWLRLDPTSGKMHPSSAYDVDVKEINYQHGEYGYGAAATELTIPGLVKEGDMLKVTEYVFPLRQESLKERKARKLANDTYDEIPGILQELAERRDW